MLQGHQTWVFQNRPVILSSAVVGGPFEAEGPWRRILTFSTVICGWGRTVMKKRKKDAGRSL